MGLAPRHAFLLSVKNIKIWKTLQQASRTFKSILEKQNK